MSPISWIFDGAFEANAINQIAGRTHLDDHHPAPFASPHRPLMGDQRAWPSPPRVTPD